MGRRILFQRHIQPHSRGCHATIRFASGQVGSTRPKIQAAEDGRPRPGLKRHQLNESRLMRMKEARNDQISANRTSAAQLHGNSTMI